MVVLIRFDVNREGIDEMKISLMLTKTLCEMLSIRKCHCDVGPRLVQTVAVELVWEGTLEQAQEYTTMKYHLQQLTTACVDTGLSFGVQGKTTLSLSVFEV